MTTARPLVRLGIGDLEDIFKNQGNDLTTLARLKHELSHRQVPRAHTLLERISKAETLQQAPNNILNKKDAERSSQSLGPLISTASQEKPKPQQIELPKLSQGFPTNFSAQPDLLGTLNDSPTPSPVAPMPAGLASSAPTPLRKTTLVQDAATLPQLALEDACRILKVSLGDSWEKVELARRKVVLKSSPIVTKGSQAEQQKKLLSEASLANDAALVIAARRSGRQ